MILVRFWYDGSIQEHEQYIELMWTQQNTKGNETKKRRPKRRGERHEEKGNHHHASALRVAPLAISDQHDGRLFFGVREGRVAWAIIINWYRKGVENTREKNARKVHIARAQP